MTKEFALKFANKVKDIVMKKSIKNRQKVPSYKDYKWIYNSNNVLKEYWNGWWISLINVHMLLVMYFNV